MAQQIDTKGFIGIVHGARSASETVSNTDQREVKSSPTSITRLDEFNAPDVILASGNGIELLEDGLFYPSKKQEVPTHDIETGFGDSSTKPIPFDGGKSINMYYHNGEWNYACGPTFEDSLDGDILLVESSDAPDIELLKEFNAHDVSSESSDAPLEMDADEIQWGNKSVTIDRSGNIFDSHGRKLEKDAWENGSIILDK